MKESSLLYPESGDAKSKAGKRSGPPNRMNDLPYREWMKFQKSFFKDEPIPGLIERCITFFTKAVWDDGQPSRSLVGGFSEYDASAIAAPRIVRAVGRGKLINQLLADLTNAQVDGPYDFILVDLRPFLSSAKQLDGFLRNHADALFRTLRRLLRAQRYCGVIVDSGGADAGGFPIPWAVALASRTHLRLRDEKIGLAEDTGQVYYCLFMQAVDDGRPAWLLDSGSLSIASLDKPIPAWTIPKPPPRKKNEILHPAKYPETLVETFVRLFTTDGENVFDPMVGTGSTIIAALRSGRNGYGIELSSKFAKIARKRVSEEVSTGLFGGVPLNGVVVEGDAGDADMMPEFSGTTFDYVITSPPYWSMLTNVGSENQQARRDKNLPLVYSQDSRDIGNVADYDRFLDTLQSIYCKVARKLKSGGVLTIVVKNVKREHIVYPLAWDIVTRLCSPSAPFAYVGNTFWCQDDIALKPFAVGIYWVSNTLHNYCLHLQKKA